MSYDLTEYVVACTADYEPLIVNTDRILQELKFCTHIGFCNHRLERTTTNVFDRPGVKYTMILAHALVTLYSKSS